MIARNMLLRSGGGAWNGKYWSKCETWNNVANPDFGETTTVDTGESPATGNATGKFGDCVYLSESTNLVWSYKTIRCLGDGDIPDQGTVSVWFKYDSAGTAGTSMFCAIADSYSSDNSLNTTCDPFGVDFFRDCYDLAVYREMNIMFGSTGKDTWQHNLGVNTWRHLYVVWDKDKGLSGGKSIRGWINGTERVSTTATLPSTTGKPFGFTVMACPYFSTTDPITYIDNLKVWDIAIDDPSDEYNSGDGKEGID